jgi:hypothetical protein
MGNTLLTFVNKYYEYDGEREIQDKGLTIGGYKSAWLADLVAAFVLENCKDLFDNAVYDRIYRDDGLVIMDGQKTNADISKWLKIFQERVNQVTGYEGLVFTVSIWRQGQSSEPEHPKVEIHKSPIFPFLDMKTSWSEEGDLQFGVYLKPGQQKEKRKEEKLERAKQRNRSVYFCIGYSNIWKEPIHKILKKLRNKFDLRLL